MGRCQVAAQNLDAEFHRLDIFGYVAVCYGERPIFRYVWRLFIKHAVKMLITRGYIDQQNKLVFVVVGKNCLGMDQNLLLPPSGGWTSIKAARKVSPNRAGMGRVWKEDWLLIVSLGIRWQKKVARKTPWESCSPFNMTWRTWVMWVKQCHKPPNYGNGKHPTFKHGDLGHGLLVHPHTMV